MVTSSTTGRAWSGIFPAVPTPFTDTLDLDLGALRGLLDWLSARPAVRGIVCGAHAGEVTNLTADEMVQLAEATAAHADGRYLTVGSLFAEGVRPALEIGGRLAATGVDALMVMPPHHWLRFGKTADESYRYVAAIAEHIDLPLILHEYPVGTAAGYATDELVALVGIPNVVAVKAGTRQMAAYGANIRALRDASPEVAVLTCHDESVLATIVQGVDGMLVAAAALLPDELGEMYAAIQDGDLRRARAIDDRIEPIMSLLYGSGQPGGRSHALLKVALHELGVLPGHAVRPPVTPVSSDDVSAVRTALHASGLAARVPSPA